MGQGAGLTQLHVAVEAEARGLVAIVTHVTHLTPVQELAPRHLRRCGVVRRQGVHRKVKVDVRVVGGQDGDPTQRAGHAVTLA